MISYTKSLSFSRCFFSSMYTRTRAICGSSSSLMKTKGSRNLNLPPFQKQLSQMFLNKSGDLSANVLFHPYQDKTSCHENNHSVRSIWYILSLAQPMAARTRHVLAHSHWKIIVCSRSLVWMFWKIFLSRAKKQREWDLSYSCPVLRAYNASTETNTITVTVTSKFTQIMCKSTNFKCLYFITFMLLYTSVLPNLKRNCTFYWTAFIWLVIFQNKSLQ